MSTSTDHRSSSDLSRSLLDEPPVPQPGAQASSSRFAYRWWGKLLVSAFIAYHVAVLLVHNLPNKGLSHRLYGLFNKHLAMNDYMRATGSSQSWAMFAPNPHRSNFFMKVFVKDADGDEWDMKHDIYGKRHYPYLFYDRMGKINRRIISQKGYRRPYAAWVCREWERTHGGTPAEEVRFVKTWTRIPPPRAVFRAMGYDPMELHVYEREQETIRCRTARNAQLPPELRARYGLPEDSGTRFLKAYGRTWWDEYESRQQRANVHARRPGGER